MDNMKEDATFREKIKYFFHCLRNKGMFQEIMECNDWLMLVSKTIQKKMVEKYGIDIEREDYFYTNSQEKYRKYLHQSVIPQLFPEEYRYFVYNGEKISVCYNDYSDYSYEKWLEETTFIKLDDVRDSIERNPDVETESLVNDNDTNAFMQISNAPLNWSEDPLESSSEKDPFKFWQTK